jgi:uncharacterized repeat protein (TIGR01451 family)
MINMQNNRLLSVLSRTILFVLFFLLALVLLSGATSAAAPTNQSADGVWADIAENDILVQGERRIVPQRYRTVTADIAALTANLAQAPMEFTAAAENNQVTLTLPLPDGGYGDYYLYESPVMHPDLAAKFPEIKTYTVKGVQDVYASGRVDITPKGFHAMVYSPGKTFYIDPYSQGDTANYMVYDKGDFARDEEDLMKELPPIGEYTPPEAGGVTTGPTLRTHRLAVATTGEYSIYHGGTVPLVMAEIVVAINRVTGIYEREIAVRMEIIPNNDDVIFLDPNTDPYTNNNGGAMLAQNQTTLDTIIGSANYDIGHVFSTGGGGVAFLNAVCNVNNKARGVTGLTNPVGDPFYVDYVAHEMGHQYGGNHTFNGSEGACSGSNRNPSTAYEPGSGSTIQAYAGICGSQNLQPNSDDYFHTISFQEMAGFSHSGGGSSCGTTISTGNNPPVVNAGTGGFFIPIETPFRLTGSATDPNGDPLTYNWEQFDLGPAGHPNSPSGNAPIFRSFTALTAPTRFFPMLSDVVDNTQTIGEILPTYTRDLTFRLTVRDNHVSPSAGGVAYEAISFDVTDTAGPFEVLTPNGPGGGNWPVGGTREVTWDVANTDAAPVNCANVDVDLSVNGGYNIVQNLAASTPNDGSVMVVVPNLPTANARVWVSCSDNIFYDMSDENFTIANEGPFSELSLEKTVTPEGSVNPGAALDYTITLINTGTAAATATITDTFSSLLLNTECNAVPGDLSETFPLDPGPANAEVFNCSADVDGSLALEINKSVDQTEISSGQAVTYTITVTNPNAVAVENVTVSDPDVAGCTPAIGTPITLNAGTSQVYVCPDNVLTEDTTNTAEVSGEITIENVATASAPGAVNSPVTSNTTVNTVALTAQDSVTVFVEGGGIYLPAVFKADPANAAPTAALPTATLPALGLSAVLLGGAMMVLIGRRK